MHKITTWTRLCWRTALTILLVMGAAAAQTPSPLAGAGTPGYLRLLESETGLQALQTSITRFQRPDGLVVDLVSAVHVGDEGYYQTLNHAFLDYDAVLYELVADPGTRPPARGEQAALSTVSRLQVGMKNLLALSHQLDLIDYSASNFVHADFTPDQFSASMKSRGESIFLMMLNTWLTAMTTPGLVRPVSDVELFKALFADDRSLALKSLLARQFADIDGVMASFSGGEKGSTLITERNKRALQVLRSQVEQGHRRLAIFYGAGHMADFEQRLADEFGLRPVSRSWVDAWNLRPPVSPQG